MSRHRMLKTHESALTFAKRTLVVFLEALTVTAVLCLPSVARAEMASGTCGTCKWSISDSGTLTIGAGTLASNDEHYNEFWPWHTYCTDITDVVLEKGVVLRGSLSHMLYFCSNLKTFDTSGWDTSNVTDMSCMFYWCGLESLDLSGWDTSNVTSMSFMFNRCLNLVSLDVSDWDTSNVESMRGTFAECCSLTSLDVSRWDTSNVEDMYGTFIQCGLLESLDLSNWDTSSLTEMSAIFGGCTSLKSLDLSGWDTSSVDGASSVFEQCGSLSEWTVGTGYAIKSDYMVPEATASNGKWWSVADGKWYAKAEIVSSRSRVADTYTNTEIHGPSQSIDDYMIEEVGKYTSSGLYAQLDFISRTGCSYEEMLQRYNVLFSQNGISDVREGIQYLSSTTSYRSAYSYLTTNEIYCAYDWYEWLYTTKKGLAARSLLYTSGLIFNYELADYVNFIDLSQGEYPGTEKCKQMLKDYMEIDDENVVSDVLANANLTAEYLSNLVELNDAIWTEELDSLMDQILNCTSQSKLEKLQRRFAESMVSQYEADTSRSIYLNGQQFADALGYSATVLEFVGATADDIVGMINLSRDVEVYQSYSRFLECIQEDKEVSFEMRFAAFQLEDEIRNGYYKKFVSICGNCFDLVEGLIYTDKSMMEIGLEKVGISEAASGTLSGALGTIAFATFIDNIIIDTGDFVKQAAYTQAYAELGASFAYRLEQDKKAFLDDGSAENAWTFFEDYTLLWKLRYKGEEQYLDMNTVKALIFAEIKPSDYSLRESVVKDTLNHLETIRFDVPAQYTIPDSIQYAQKAVVHCPVDVEVRSTSGTRIALLKDGVESDVSNSYGRFVVFRDSYSGDYVKVACLSSTEDVTIEATAVDGGNVSLSFATIGDSTVRRIDNMLMEEGDVIYVGSGELVRNGRFSIDRGGDGSTDETGKATVVQSDAATVTDVSLSVGSVDLEEGEGLVLGVSVAPDDAANRSVTWAVADESVAYVTDGKVIGVGEGQTTVSCTSLSNPDATAECTVTVRPAATKTDLSSATVYNIPRQAYTGREVTPAITVLVGQRTLRCGVDYIVSYTNNTGVGTAIVEIAGRGSYKGTKTVTFEIAEPSGWTRLAGDTRYDTMATIVSEGFSSSEWAVVATGANFPDALVASSLAGSKGCPVILTAKKSLSRQAKIELSRLGVNKAFIMGDESSVSAAVQTAMEGMGIAVTRIAGPTRQDTSLEAARSLPNPKSVVIANGGTFADALSIGPWCYWTSTPILLTSKVGRLSASQLEWLGSCGARRLVVVGGSDMVPDSTSESARKALGVSKSAVTRLAGKDRYATSAEVAEWEIGQGMGVSNMAVATGRNFPDALAGAALCGKDASIIALVSSTNSSALEVALSQNRSKQLIEGYVIGGVDSVPASIMNLCKSLTAGD